jgi:hypothetical protein
MAGESVKREITMDVGSSTFTEVPKAIILTFTSHYTVYIYRKKDT